MGYEDIEYGRSAYSIFLKLLHKLTLFLSENAGYWQVYGMDLQIFTIWKHVCIVINVYLLDQVSVYCPFIIKL